MNDPNQSKSISYPQQSDEKMINKQIFICILLAISILIIYVQVKDYDFINFDDTIYVTENQFVQDGLTKESIDWAFTTPSKPFWHPVTWLSHMLDIELYGLNPAGHHLTNVVIHLFNTLFLFIVLHRMTGAFWKCSVVAALFAVHPLNVESVAWVAERKNVLSTFFWMITMWAYIFYVSKKNIKRYCMVAFFLALGLMSKPMLVTLPFVLLMLDYWPLGRLKLGQNLDSSTTGNTDEKKFKQSSIVHLIIEKIPLLLLSIGSSLMTLYFRESDRIPKAPNISEFLNRSINALVSYVEYLEKIMWPKSLSILYPHPVGALPVWKGIVCGVFILCISLAILKVIRRLPYLSLGWFWFLGTMFPVIGIIQVGNQALADRFSYIPQIGIFIIIAWGIPELMAKWRLREKMLSISVGIVLPTLILLSLEQTSHWKSSKAIYTHAIEVTDTIYPSFAIIYYNLATNLTELGEFEEANEYYKKAISTQPEFAQAHNNLATNLGEQKRLVEATYHYKKAIRIQPDFAEAYFNLARVLAEQHLYNEASIRYLEALKLNPENPEIHFSFGNTLGKLRKFGEAIKHYSKAIMLKPDHAQAHNNLGGYLGQQGNFTEAAIHFKEALKIDPEHKEAQKNFNIAQTILSELSK